MGPRQAEHDVCNVCGRERPVTVHASSLGPASFARCDECIALGAEPFMMIATRFFVHGGVHEAGLAELKDAVTFFDGQCVGVDVVAEHYPSV